MHTTKVISFKGEIEKNKKKIAKRVQPETSASIDYMKDSCII